ncbi:hypothetical protein LTR17_023736 [Elasticomyces elasticus]|nr:hypothetical protein LTR17_023736 [Elasticomyces elasticus]
MFSFMKTKAVLLAFNMTIHAYLVERSGPTPASYNQGDTHGWTPKPTQDPLSPHFLGMNKGSLLRRQDGTAICGYSNGIASLAWTCGLGYACGTQTDESKPEPV